MRIATRKLDLTRVRADLEVAYKGIPFTLTSDQVSIRVQFQKWYQALSFYRSFIKQLPNGGNILLSADRALAENGMTLFVQGKRFPVLGLRSNRFITKLLIFLAR